MRTFPEQALPSLGYVIFYVVDVAKAAVFWRDAFGFTIKFTHESGEYAELSTGQTTLAFVSDNLMTLQGVRYRANRTEDEPAGAQISLTTKDPEALFARAIELGAKSIKALERKPWGQVSGFVRDVNGVLVEICTPIEHRA
jgi:lactoylglutathione lyase